MSDATAQAIQEIIDNGSDISKPMEVDFFISIPSLESAKDIKTEIEQLGFKTDTEQDDESAEWTLYCSKKMILNYDDVVEIETKLESIAKKVGGYSDGFGSYGNAE